MIESCKSPVRSGSGSEAARAAEELLRFVGKRRFSTILADPPWQFLINRTGKDGARAPPPIAVWNHGHGAAILLLAGCRDRRARRRTSTFGCRTRSCRTDCASWMRGASPTRPTSSGTKSGRTAAATAGAWGSTSATSPSWCCLACAGSNARTLAAGRRQVNYLLATGKREHSRKPDELYPL